MKKNQKSMPCPYCYPSDQGFAFRTGGKPVADLRAMAGKHEPSCLLREIVQYPPASLSTGEWHEYIARFVEKMPKNLSPTMRRVRLTEEAVISLRVFKRADLLFELGQPHDALKAACEALVEVSNSLEWSEMANEGLLSDNLTDTFERIVVLDKDEEKTEALVEHFLRGALGGKPLGEK